MASWKDVLEETGKRLGLPRRPGNPVLYGVKDGYPVQLSVRSDGGGIAGLIRYDDPARDAAVIQALEKVPDFAKKLKGKLLLIEEGVVGWQFPKALFRTPKPEAVAGEFERLLDILKAQAPEPPASCRLCKGAQGTPPVLVNGVVDRLCNPCVQTLKKSASEADRAYEDLPLNLPFALFASAGLSLVGAAAWGGLAIATNSMYWMVAIGVGWLIAWGTVKAAGKGGLIVQTLIALFTVLSVLLGQMLFAAQQFNEFAQQKGQTVDWVGFTAATPGILVAMGSDTLFSLGGGLLGAFYAAKMASKPKFDVEVERA
jgi:hypothetical protein